MQDRQKLLEPTLMTTSISLTCTKIIVQTHDVKTFIFSVPLSLSITYLAGQHINFSLVIKGQQRDCCYTLSSSPTNTDRVSLTIKRIGNGVMSNYFHDYFSLDETAITDTDKFKQIDSVKARNIKSDPGVVDGSMMKDDRQRTSESNDLCDSRCDPGSTVSF